MGAHVEIPRPYESAPGRFSVDLMFPATSKRRAEQHHDVAWVLADVHGLEASTPYKVNPRWSVYEEQWGNGERHGWLDMRRLRVYGPARALARYLVALERVLGEVEALATRAVRVFGAWKRSAAAGPFLEYEDVCTLRVRSRQFRADTLRALVQGLGARTRPVGERDSSRPLWEQYQEVAEEVWAAGGGVDLEQAEERAVTDQVLRMVPDSEVGRAVVAEAERLVQAEGRRVEGEGAGACQVVESARGRREAGARFLPCVEVEHRSAGDEQLELFAAEDAPLAMAGSDQPRRRHRVDRKCVPVMAVGVGVSAGRRGYAPAA